jgi:hypothetical protein
MALAQADESESTTRRAFRFVDRRRISISRQISFSLPPSSTPGCEHHHKSLNMQQGHNIYQFILIMLSFCPEHTTNCKAVQYNLERE